MFRKAATVSSSAAAACAAATVMRSPSPSKAFMDNHRVSDHDNVIFHITPADISDGFEWKKQSEKCPLCKVFLDTPCQQNFKYWSKCVDNSKAIGVDPNGACSEYTSQLQSCMQSHPNNFKEAIKDTREREKQKQKQKDRDMEKENEEINKISITTSNSVSDSILQAGEQSIGASKLESIGSTKRATKRGATIALSTREQ
jgi:hypothetical protein